MITRHLTLFCLLIVVLTLGSGRVWALSLYTGEAIIEPGDSGEDTALRALDEVLIRLTGQSGRSLVDELGLSGSILRQLVSSEQRVQRPRIGPDGLPQADQLRLRIDFDPVAIDELLARQDLPRLGRERPSILLWLAFEDETGVELDGGPYLEQTIAEQARRLGLDVVRPLGDLIDRADMDVFDIRGGFLGSAEPSARRYGAQLIAMLDVRQIDVDPAFEADPGVNWRAQWFWRLEGRDDGLQLETGDLSAVVAVGLERMLAALAQRFAVIADAEHATQRRVVVQGIEGEAQYAEVLRHLQSLGAVADVLVLSARASEVEFQLRLRNPGLEDGLALGGVLGIEGRSPDGALLLRLSR